MNKPKLFFIIDVLMFLCLMAMAGLGLLIKYVLLPGKERWAKYGRNVELYWLGWDRHDWGWLHFYLALIFLGLLTVHIILHWQQIVGLYSKFIPSATTRSRLGMIFLLLAVLLVYFPFLITPEVVERGRGPGLRGHQVSSLAQP